MRLWWHVFCIYSVHYSVGSNFVVLVLYRNIPLLARLIVACASRWADYKIVVKWGRYFLAVNENDLPAECTQMQRKKTSSAKTTLINCGTFPTNQNRTNKVTTLYILSKC